ncbi:retrovirus-related Pol polyprotein from transposon 412 [Trichonephila clavipes]|nr:retrovirus-related Pol polyprotein from transposon 412 [Trichonephila clavipes]
MIPFIKRFSYLHLKNLDDLQPDETEVKGIVPSPRIGCEFFGLGVKSNSQYNTPALFVKQKEKWRLVLDFRKLNEITVTQDFVIPPLDDILHEISGSNYFSALDMKSAFNQIPLHFADRHKTAFSTPDGDKYQFNRLCFGLKNSPKAFQSIAQEVLGDLLHHGALVYIDDIILFTKTIDEHFELLGFVVTPEGILIDKDKSLSINEFPVPKDQKQIKSFLGCCNFYRRYIKNFAKRALPLTNLLRKDTPFEWTSETQEAFDDIKKAILNPTVLALPDQSAELQITTDASSRGIGAVLEQKYPNSEYNTPALFVKQKEKWRLVLDFRKLNEITVTQDFVIPPLDDILHEISGSNYFSALDMKSAFNQIPLHFADRHKTAFSTPDGDKYQFNRLCFGLKNSPKAFQSIAQEVLGDLLHHGALVYIDDIILFTKTIDEHFELLVLDFRKLNEITVTQDFVIPPLDDILHEISGSNYFSALDMKSAFNQIPLHFADRHKTAFSTPDGDKYQFNRLCFGLKNSPKAFQSIAQEVLGDLLHHGALVYIDDIILFTKTIDEHFELLGFVVTPEGILIDKDKSLSINEFPVPKDQKQIKSFLGCCNFYRRYIKNFAKRALPLTNLLRKDTPFEWTSETQEAFDDIKKAILNPTVLALPDQSAELQITTDASSRGIGAVLEQKYPNSEYNTPALFVKQKEKWRLVLDFRKLNEITVTQDFVIPPLDDILHEISGSNYFSALDMKSAFNQIPLHFADRHKTAFSTPDGDKYQFNRLCFGLKNSPKAFQSIAQEVLGDLLHHGALVYIDDIILFTKTIDEHFELLGFVITPEGILIDKDKSVSINEFPVPKDQKQIKSFLECCNFYRRYIKNFAKRALPLTNLLRKDTPFEWTSETQEAFDDIKKAILNPPVLALPDQSAELQITTDASSRGIGAVLEQKYPNSEVKPLYFFF